MKRKTTYPIYLLLLLATALFLTPVKSNPGSRSTGNKPATKMEKTIALQENEVLHSELLFK